MGGIPGAACSNTDRSSLHKSIQDGPYLSFCENFPNLNGPGFGEQVTSKLFKQPRLVLADEIDSASSLILPADGPAPPI